MRQTFAIIFLFWARFSYTLVQYFRRHAGLSTFSPRRMLSSTEVKEDILSEIKKENITFQIAMKCDLNHVAIWIARERMQVVPYATDLSCMMSPAFSMVFIRELERLENNFHSKDSNNDETRGNSAFRHDAIIAKMGSESVAYVDLEGRPGHVVSQIPIPYLSDLIVSPKFRNQVRFFYIYAKYSCYKIVSYLIFHNEKGIGTALLLHCQQYVRDNWREKHLYLHSEAGNLNALRLYIRCGFQPVALERGDHSDENGLISFDLKDICTQDLYSLEEKRSDDVIGGSNCRVDRNYVLEERAVSVKLSDRFVAELSAFDRVLLRIDLT